MYVCHVYIIHRCIHLLMSMRHRYCIAFLYSSIRYDWVSYHSYKATVYRGRLLEASLDEYTSVADASQQMSLMHVVNEVGLAIFEKSVVQTKANLDARDSATAVLDGISWHEQAGIRVKMVRSKVIRVKTVAGTLIVD